MHNAMLHLDTLGGGVASLSHACHWAVTPLSPLLSPCCHPAVTLLSPYCHPDADTLLPHSALPVMKGEKIFFCCKVGCVYSLIGPSLQKQCFTAFYGWHKACAAGFCYVTLTAAQDKGCTLVQSKGGRPSTGTVPDGVQLSALATKVLDRFHTKLVCFKIEGAIHRATKSLRKKKGLTQTGKLVLSCLGLLESHFGAA